MTKLTLPVLLGALLSSGTAYAQSCGDILTVDTTLTEAEVLAVVGRA